MATQKEKNKRLLLLLGLFALGGVAVAFASKSGSPTTPTGCTSDQTIVCADGSRVVSRRCVGGVLVPVIPTPSCVPDICSRLDRSGNITINGVGVFPGGQSTLIPRCRTGNSCILSVSWVNNTTNTVGLKAYIADTGSNSILEVASQSLSQFRRGNFLVRIPVHHVGDIDLILIEETLFPSNPNPSCLDRPWNTSEPLIAHYRITMNANACDPSQFSIINLCP